MPPLNDPPDSDDGKPSALDPATLFLSGQLAEIATLCRANGDDLREFRVEVMPRLDKLDLKVFGKITPALRPARGTPRDDTQPILSSPPLTDRVATSETSIDHLAQEVSNLRGQVRRNIVMTAQQSRAMGLAPPPADDENAPSKTAAYLGSRKSFEHLIALIAAVAALVAALRGVQGPSHGPAPAPLSAPAGSR